MSMTKKHIELVAASIQRTITVTGWIEKNKIKRQAKLEVLQLVACDLAGSLYGDNPEFDRDRFLKACGVEA